MKWKGSVLALAATALLSCSKPAIPVEGGASPAGVGPSAGDPAPVANYNIGDVETAIKMTVQVSEKSRRGTVEYSELETKRGTLAIAEATVSTPYPKELWISAKAFTTRGFREQDAVLIRHRIYLDDGKEPVAERKFVWSGINSTSQPSLLEIDLMPLLGELPGSVLLHSRAEIVWFPDTDPATIDPEGSDVSPERPIERLSNSLRITFK